MEKVHSLRDLTTIKRKENTHETVVGSDGNRFMGEIKSEDQH
jgi:hypothetical protein